MFNRNCQGFSMMQFLEASSRLCTRLKWTKLNINSLARAPDEFPYLPAQLGSSSSPLILQLLLGRKTQKQENDEFLGVVIKILIFAYHHRF